MQPLVSGCGSALGAALRANLTLYLVYLHSPDVSYHQSDLLARLSEVHDCVEVRIVQNVLLALYTLGERSSPLQSYDVEFVSNEDLLALFQYHGLNGDWPVFAYLAKLQRIILQHRSQSSNEDRFLSGLLLDPWNVDIGSASSFTAHGEFLRTAWIAANGGSAISEQDAHTYLTHIRRAGLVQHEPLGVAIALLATSYAKPLSEAQHFVHAAHKLASGAIVDSRNIMSSFWPIWHFLDRATIQSIVTVRRTLRPYVLNVLPIREKVCDFVRACRLPYCERQFFDVAASLRITQGPLNVVEVGANLGDCGAHLLSNGVAAHVSFFEPVPFLAASLRGTVARNGWGGRSDVIEKACGSHHGFETLHFVGKNNGNLADVSSLDAKETPASNDKFRSRIHSFPSVRVPKDRLDDLLVGSGAVAATRDLPERSSTSPHLVKVSVSGALLSTLEGGTKTLSSAQALYLTLAPLHLKAGSMDIVSIVAWLRARGFVLDIVGSLVNASDADVLWYASTRDFFSIIAWRDVAARSLMTALPRRFKAMPTFVAHCKM